MRDRFRERFNVASRSFSGRERAAFFGFGALIALGIFGALWQINVRFLVTVPAHGGELTEGVVGAPRFINPLLAITDADRDLTALVYSGLLRALPTGELVADLAESYAVSPDGLQYSVILRENIWFHDGKPVTADDVLFTVAKAQDSALKSPRRASWEGVAVEKISDREIRFTIRQPFAPFIENLTLGIIPKHIWQSVDVAQFGFSTFNVQPIGSGPYAIERLKQDSSGVPSYYDLASFNRFALGEPYIPRIRVRFYANETALRGALVRQEVDHMSAFSPTLANDLEANGFAVTRSPLPRVFGVFFNSNQAPVLVDQSVRKALSLVIDKEKIVSEVLYGYGKAIDGPIPPGLAAFSPSTSTPTLAQRRASAEMILQKAGWKKGVDGILFKKLARQATSTLSLSLSTSDIPELKAVAERVANDWKALGVAVEVKVFESGDLNQNVIRPRKYDALLFGEVVGRDADLFAFWHSSQRNDPGLNIALYANRIADNSLEELRSATNTAERLTHAQKFTSEIATDVPAVFLYSPHFLYLISPRLQGFSVGSIASPGDRFSVVHDWYIETDRVWKIFAANSR